MFVLSLISSLLNAVNAIYAKKIILDIRDNNSFMVITFAIVAVLLGVSMPWEYSFHVTLHSLLLLILVIALDTTANVLFFKTMERIEVSILAAYSALTPLFTYVVDSFFVGFDLHILISVVIIVCGIYLLNIKGKNPLTPLIELKNPGNLLGLATAMVYGVSMVPTQQLLLHDINPPTMYMFRASGIALVIFLLYRPKLWFPRQMAHLSLRSLSVIGQWLCLFTALRLANGTLVVALSYTSPLFAIFLARFIFQEKITWGKIAASTITILGILSIRLL
ncbi:DMT family transporter [Fodinisporobacter ferrooxydans]|uniref:DMT family transporter n=1 Tax=Fodinisporobacter ferrooxydans TaxID=2901836 RepID=A0ABY4CPE2_9BACL|nr:DMT family transporter [Alicyclobacillaceae bacterium MYW30-H2]